MLKSTFRKVWNSPVLMTWGNLSAKSSNLLLLLPLALRIFPQEDMVVWYLYFTIYSLQMLVDFGFLPTLSRFVAYAVGGISLDGLKDVRTVVKNERAVVPDAEAVGYIHQATKLVYAVLALSSLVLALGPGSLLVMGSMSASSSPVQSWLGWVLVSVITSVSLYGNAYVSLLTGFDRVAITQRWQMVSSFFAVSSAAITLWASHSLLYSISIFYGWQLINFVINRELSKTLQQPPEIKFSRSKTVVLIRECIWPTAWRSGVGMAMSHGIIQLSALVVPNLAEASLAVSYMIGLQFVRALSSFSQAPFYSRLPYFAHLYGTGQTRTLLAQFKRRLQQSLGFFTFMFLVVGLMGNHFLILIDSRSSFPNDVMWITIGAAFFLERFGAMYLQLYTLTNHILWHIANGVTGVLMIVLSFLLFDLLSLYSLPVSMFMAYLFFLLPFVMKKAYQEFSLSFWVQERGALLPGLSIFIVCGITIYVF